MAAVSTLWRRPRAPASMRPRRAGDASRPDDTRAAGASPPRPRGPATGEEDGSARHEDDRRLANERAAGVEGVVDLGSLEPPFAAQHVRAGGEAVAEVGQVRAVGTALADRSDLRAVEVDLEVESRVDAVAVHVEP